MGDARVAFSPSHGTVDKVLDTRFLCGVSKALALLNLPFRADPPEILYAVNAVDTPTSPLKRRRIFQVSLHHFDALPRKLLRGMRGRVAR